MTNKNLKFDEVHSSFRNKIHRYLSRLTGKDEADDLTQEVFIKVNQALNNFRGESQLSTWIYRIATNTAMDRLRSASYKPKVQMKSLDQSKDENAGGRVIWATDLNQSPEDEIIRNEMNECIRNFVEKLPENYRMVLILSELEELKNNDIAQILGITLSTVKIRLHRAREKLRKELETNCRFYRDEQNQLACDLKTAFENFREEY